MKISHFPDFLPDETVFSVCSRYLDRMQFHSPIIAGQNFFGRNAKGIVTDLPFSIEHLIQALPPYHIYTSDMIIDQHTLFSLYAPFLPFERAHALRQRMKTNGTAVHWIAGIITSKVSRQQWLRYCPQCVENDRLTYGESYWHRIHQIPGVSVCPNHEIMLENSSVSMFLGENIVQFCSAEHTIVNPPLYKAPNHIHATLLQLARNAKWLLESSPSIEHQDIKQQYLRLLTKRSLATATGKVRYAKLRDAVLDYYSTNLLENLGCSIVRSNENWLANWTRIQHPLHHLLFIQFLCETAQEFFIQPQHAPNLFGEGPWPCLNPLCSYYKKRVITSYTIRQGNLNRPVAKFACQCGFTYSRTGPDINDDDLFRIGKISQFGNVWDQQLTTYWLEQTISTLEIARLMHSDVETIRRQAARLDLPFAPNIPRRGKRPKIYQDFINEQRDLYRNLWEETLNTNPDATITETVNTAHKAYSWLKRHDYDWLKEYSPATILSSKNGRLVQGKIQLQSSYYSAIDADLAKSVSTIAEEIRTESSFPIQVTRQLLVARIGSTFSLRRSSSSFNFLPLTMNAFDESIETYIDFIWRKLRWAVQSYLTEQALPSFVTFIRRAQIGYGTSTRPIIKQLTQIAYSSLTKGTILSHQMPNVYTGVENATVKNIEPITPSSLAMACINQQLMLPNAVIRQTQQKVYDLVPILLLTVAAIVNGAETCSAIASWSYRNEELLHWFGIPKGKFPNHVTLQKMYAKLDTDSFENILELWLQKTFPLTQNKTKEMKIYTRRSRVPGIELLQPYRYIASEVVAKLR